MESSKSLTFKYNAFTPAFRRRIFLLIVLLILMFWILAFNSGFYLHLTYSPLEFVISNISNYIDSTLGILMSILVAYILQIYLMVLLPPQLLLLFFNLFDKSAGVDFYEDHVVLSYGNKEIKLNKNKVVINLVIKKQRNLSCTIYTPDTDITFLSSKLENKTLMIDYEESSLYYVMREVREFLCPKTEDNQFSNTSPNRS